MKNSDKLPYDALRRLYLNSVEEREWLFNENERLRKLLEQALRQPVLTERQPEEP